MPVQRLGTWRLPKAALMWHGFSRPKALQPLAREIFDLLAAILEDFSALKIYQNSLGKFNV